ncbi:MAG: FAD-binding protein [Legionellaceae bacterium]|nr:FAD-binding protein [Legionellaceae bacterium]
MKIVSPMAACHKDSSSNACKQALEKGKDPFYLEAQPGATQMTGWLKAWESSSSVFAVAVENSQDISQAVLFAKKHHLKLVVKGTGHDYLGRSSAPNSLLIWTHNMRNITIDDQFKASGCEGDKGEPSVTVGAGVRWIEAYKAVTVEHGRFVQGGFCTSVGAAGGYIQGGGYGSFSKKFGTSSASILQAEVVTADGRILTVNRCQNPDLFWALKGGGGGTFAVVSKVTLKTHELPENFGMVNGEIQAKSPKDFKLLILQFIHFYREKISNEHWGDGLVLTPSNKMILTLLFQGLDKQQSKEIWQDFVNWVKVRPKQYHLRIQITVIPARKFWDYEYRIKHFPESIMVSHNKQVAIEEFWWHENQGEVLSYMSYYKSRYLPLTLFDKAHSQRFADALFNASKLINVSIFFNKGLAGASKEALASQSDTAMHPNVVKTAALVMLSGVQQYVFPDIQGLKPDLAKADADAKTAQKAAQFIYDIAPGAGTYANEADYFEPDWQRSFWGENYPRLLAIKKEVDPDGLFHCHHCVGSE